MYGRFGGSEEVEHVTVTAEIMAPVPESITESDLGYEMDYDKVTKEICQYNGFDADLLDDIGDSIDEGYVYLRFYTEIAAPADDDPVEYALDNDTLHDHFTDWGFTEQGTKYLLAHAKIDGEV